MNLIEQLGGYGKAKLELENTSPDQYGYRFDLQMVLLEYRRQHNIFEVGDLIIDMALSNDVIKYHDDYNYMPKWVFSFIRHATAEEIKAGHRL